jgi:glycosyltransferase involved in cell wall biosynthesis
MRVLHVTPYAPEAWAYGGIPRVVGSLARGLARRGHTVTVCTTDACDDAARLPGRVNGVHGNVDVRVFRNVSNRLAYHLQLFLPLGMHTFLQREARAFDVAHLHACRNVPGAIAAYHLRRAGIPYVLAPNGTAPIIERRFAAKMVFDAVAGDRVLGGASRLLAVSDAERRQFLDIGVESSRIRVIPNPIHVDEHSIHPHKSVAGRFRERYRFGSQPIVLFLGRLSPRKRLDVLVRAFAQLRASNADAVRLVIAGNDMGAEAATHRLVKTLGIQAHATFTGLLTQGERIEALVDSDVTVYPSEHEIFGLVPIESLLAKTPVVVAGDSGCGEVINQIGGGKVVPVGDVNALANAIDEILADPRHWRAAAAIAGDRARATFGENVVAGRMELLYGEMVAKA